MPVRTLPSSQVFERLAALLVLLFFQKLFARDHDVAALLVELDDGDFHRLALHAIQIPDGTQVHLRARQEGARALNVDGQAALDAFHDDALDRLLLVVSALNLVPRPQPLCLQVREVDVALFGFTLVPHHVDLVAGLELGLALVIENLRNRRHAFGFRPDIDDDVGRGQFDHGAFDYVIVADRFLGFGSRSCGGRRRNHRCQPRHSRWSRELSGALVVRSVLVRVVLRSGRGGSQWFRGRGLCVLGSV